MSNEIKKKISKDTKTPPDNSGFVFPICLNSIGSQPGKQYEFEATDDENSNKSATWSM